MQCPLYSAKAELLPGSTFVVGHDTAIRLVNPKYYGGHDGMVAAVRWKSGAGRAGGWEENFIKGDTPAPLYKQKGYTLATCGAFSSSALLDRPRHSIFSLLAWQLQRILDLGCSFLVAGRLEAASGRFMTMTDVQVPEELAGLFEDIPEETFRADISSTEIRERLRRQVAKAV